MESDRTCQAELETRMMMMKVEQAATSDDSDAADYLTLMIIQDSEEMCALCSDDGRTRDVRSKGLGYDFITAFKGFSLSDVEIDFSMG